VLQWNRAAAASLLGLAIWTLWVENAKVQGVCCKMTGARPTDPDHPHAGPISMYVGFAAMNLLVSETKMVLSSRIDDRETSLRPHSFPSG
jgi:hypothetical protein